MIWIPCTHDENVHLYTENSVVEGTVRYMPKSQTYLATTNKQYLGQYKSLKNAQLAVETKRAKECKATGKLIT